MLYEFITKGCCTFAARPHRSASVLERGRLRGFGLGARTRPAPGFFFSDVSQFDLTDFAGQKRDLRTMEPVAGEIGHCFVVGARHQLRASMSAGWRGSAGQVRRNCRLGRQFRRIFSWEESRPWRGLGRLEAPMPGRRGRNVAR